MRLPALTAADVDAAISAAGGETLLRRYFAAVVETPEPEEAPVTDREIVSGLAGRRGRARFGGYLTWKAAQRGLWQLDTNVGRHFLASALRGDGGWGEYTARAIAWGKELLGE